MKLVKIWGPVAVDAIIAAISLIITTGSRGYLVALVCLQMGINVKLPGGIKRINDKELEL